MHYSFTYSPELPGLACTGNWSFNVGISSGFMKGVETFCPIMPTFKKFHQLKDLGSRKWRGLVSLVGLASHVGPHLLPTVSLSTKYKRLRQVIMESRKPCPFRHDVITHWGQKFSEMSRNFIPCTGIYIRYGFNKNEKWWRLGYKLTLALFYEINYLRRQSRWWTSWNCKTSPHLT